MNDTNSASDPDNVAITLQFADGSVGNIIYTSAGDPGFPKERLEVFGGGRVGVIENWRQLLVQGNRGRIRVRRWTQADKGFLQEMTAFAEGARTGHSPISFQSLVATTRTTFAIQKALRTGEAVAVSESG